MIWFISLLGDFLQLVPSPLINFGMANLWVSLSVLDSELSGGQPQMY